MLKKLLTILLLSIYLFNLIGYNLVFQYLIDNSDIQLAHNINSKQIDERNLVEVKVALNMPYLSNTKNYERVDGQIELNGVAYNYVKRKVSGDTLYLLCVPNFSKTQLCNAKADYAKETNDLPSKKNTESNTKKAGFCNDYVCINTQHNLSIQSQSNVFENNFLSPKPSSPFVQFITQPPDNITC